MSVYCQQCTWFPEGTAYKNMGEKFLVTVNSIVSPHNFASSLHGWRQLSFIKIDDSV